MGEDCLSFSIIHATHNAQIFSILYRLNIPAGSQLLHTLVLKRSYVRNSYISSEKSSA
jgi:hypothetical protein